MPHNVCTLKTVNGIFAIEGNFSWSAVFGLLAEDCTPLSGHVKVYINQEKNGIETFILAIIHHFPLIYCWEGTNVTS